MKKTILFLCSFSIATVVSAVQVYEPFNYPKGSSLAGQGGWVLTAGTSPTVATNGLVTPGLQPAAEGNSLLFGNGAMEVRRFMVNGAGPGEFSGGYWYSLAFTVLDLGTLSADGGFIAAFSSTNQPMVYGGMLCLRKDIGGNPNGYNIGVAMGSILATDIAWSGTVFTVGQTNFVVCKYHTGETTEETLLWINPDPSSYGQASPPPQDLTAGQGPNALAAVGQIVLRQGSATEGPGAILVDTLRVEGGWPHVTPIPLTMTIAKANATDITISWGGVQNVYLQQASSLTPPVTWVNLNSDASIRNYTVLNATTNPVPKFYRLIAWYP